VAFSGLLAAFGLRESLLAIPATGQNQQPRWQHCSAKKTSAGIKKKSILWLEVQHLHWSLQWQGWQPAHASCFFHWAGLQRRN